MVTPLRLAVFDVDGTLVDSQHNIVAAMLVACDAHGLCRPPAEAVRRVIGLSLVEAVAALLPEQEPIAHERIAESYKDAFVTLRSGPGWTEPLFPGAVAALDALEADGWALGLATGKSRRGVDVMIERHGLTGRFATIQTPDTNPGKPNPAMLRSAMAEVGADASATVMIGDTTFDILMARAANTGAVAVGWGYHPVGELRAAGAHAVVGDYAGLLIELAGEAGCARARS
ncbi:MAG: HAD-IA family hydrolase [Alphaproteobacteria bacterium]|nr:HAD-IA family hydrolase [Alphaproteobacteria bacterium]